MAGNPIADVCDMSAETSLAWMDGLQLEGSAAQIAGEVLKEIRARLGFLNDVGLNYLTLSRAAKPCLAARRNVFVWRPRSVPVWWA